MEEIGEIMGLTETTARTRAVELRLSRVALRLAAGTAANDSSFVAAELAAARQRAAATAANVNVEWLPRSQEPYGSIPGRLQRGRSGNC